VAKTRWVLVFLATTLMATAGCGLWLHHNLWGSRTHGQVSLEIAAGSPARRIVNELHGHGLVPSPLAALLYLRARADGRSMHFGRYRFDAGLRPVDVLEMVLDGNLEMFEVTVVEGDTAAEIGDLFSTLGVGNYEEWQSLLSRVEWIAPVVPDAPSLEGFFFPDTYRFAVGIDAKAAALHLTDKFLAVWGEERREVDALWGSPLEIVTLASLIEAETSIAEERPLIAGVFVNRLRRGMLLQCDPTVIYALERRNEWRGRLLRIDLEVDDPYNTYRYPGLPPGPINCPGRAAIAAALDPAATSFLYFVARPGGGHTFSSSLAEHNRAVAQLRAARR
jgi:UPF0755 protein